ncbi:MAG: hypothetical protein FE834_04350, partial [Gammaproteobacteria bacterium]|nr:hypothetical protein [Gammaproteobacteria bacterium]
ELKFTATAPGAGNGAATIESITLGTGANAATVTGITTSEAMLITQVNQSVTGFELDNTAPAALTMALDADTGSDATDGITNNNKVNVSGMETGASWKYSKDSGATWADGSGTSFTLTEGTYAANAIQVKQFDAAMNDSVVAKMGAVTVDTTDPAFSSADTGQGVVGQNIEVYDAEVTGGDTGITYTISGTDAGKYKIGSADGKITYDGTPTVKTDTPDQVTITAKDVAGNSATKDVSISVVGKPVASSSIDGATNMDVRSPIVLTFSEEVAVTTGTTIKFKLTDTNDSDNDATNGVDGFGWKHDKTQNNQEFEVTSDMITIKNVGGKSVVTINPEYDFDFGTHYTISIDAGAFTGTNSHQESLAVNMSFDTVTPAKSTITAGESDGLGKRGIKSQIQVAETDALVDSNWWIDAHQSSAIQGSAVVVQAGLSHGINKDIAIAASLRLDGSINEGGYIRLWGETDAKDIVYGDIANKEITFVDSKESVIGDRTKQFIFQFNWGVDFTTQEDANTNPLSFNKKRGAVKDFGDTDGATGAVSVIFSAIDPVETNTSFASDSEFNLLNPSHGAILYG